MRDITALRIAVLALVILATPLASETQQPAKVPRLEVFWINPLPAAGHLLEGFRHGLSE